MNPTATRTASLVTSSGRSIGELNVEEVRGELLMGTFTPGPDYPAVEPLFRAFAEIVEDQVLSLLDQVTEPIEALGIRLADGTPVWDVQIYPDGNASCRVGVRGGRTGAP
jgi:hypothetical protein